MMKPLDLFMIVKNEEELLPYSLESLMAVAQVVGANTLSIVDNGSTDGTMGILEAWHETFGAAGVNVLLKLMPDTPHHGELRTAAIRPLTAPWIFYLDADETVSRNLPGLLKWALENDLPSLDVVSFERYWTHTDRLHWAGGYEPAQVRCFRNYDEVHFPQKVHTEPMYPYGSGLQRRRPLQGAYVFDHTSCKSRAALRAKGERYQWAVGEPYIGDPDTYVRLTDEGQAKIEPLPPRVAAQVAWGPMGE